MKKTIISDESFSTQLAMHNLNFIRASNQLAPLAMLLLNNQ
jgi:hypothetical protein